MNKMNPLIRNFISSHYTNENWAHDYLERYEGVISAASIMAERISSFSSQSFSLTAFDEIPNFLRNLQEDSNNCPGLPRKIVSRTVACLPHGVRIFLAKAGSQVFADSLKRIADFADGVQQFEVGSTLTEGVDLELLRGAAEEFDEFINSKYFSVSKPIRTSNGSPSL